MIPSNFDNRTMWTADNLDLVWHGEIAEQQPALYAIIDAAWLAHGRAMQSCLTMMAQSLHWRSRLHFRAIWARL